MRDEKAHCLQWSEDKYYQYQQDSKHREQRVVKAQTVLVAQGGYDHCNRPDQEGNPVCASLAYASI
jgi:hypothetical protein